MLPEELENMTVSRLKEFLKVRGKRSSSSKADLLHLAKLFVASPTLAEDSVVFDKFNKELTEKRKIFDEKSLHWLDISSTPRAKIPKGYDIVKINTFLTTSLFVHCDGQHDEVIDSGTEKPATKGRQMYSSGKIQLCEVASNDNVVLFRSTMEASYKANNFRHPCVALGQKSGTIFSTRCTCEQNADGKCSHVAALLFLIEDLSMHIEPRMTRACTSQGQKWAQGKRSARNPQPLHLTNYNKKIKADSCYSTDPRPPHLRCTTPAEINGFVANLESSEPSMWLDVLGYHYKDYPLSPDRKIVLSQLVKEFFDGLYNTVDKYSSDPLSTPTAVHITGTEDQTKSSLWFKAREFLVTASRFQEFKGNPQGQTKKLLYESPTDLSSVLAVQWGCTNEKNAIEEFEKLFGKTTKAGLFVSRSVPFLGASPDALFGTSIIEVKCPYVLRDWKPSDISKLTDQQQKNYFCELIDGQLKLKRTHKYFWQIQCQLFVCGYQEAHFIVWTPNAINIECIQFDSQLFNSALGVVKANYEKVFVPEYFELRLPRNLPAFTL